MTKEFILGKNTKIVAKWQKTTNGFRHMVEYHNNGKILQTRSVSYLNRSWESYQYETAIKALLDKMIKKGQLDAEMRPKILAITSGQAKADLDRKFGTMSALATMGGVLGKTKKQKNSMKLSAIRATMGAGLSLPDDWEQLSEDVKEERLDKIIAMTKGN